MWSVTIWDRIFVKCFLRRLAGFGTSYKEIFCSPSKSLAQLDNEDNSKPLPDSEDLQINENRRKVSNSLRLDVKNINIEIPQDVHFQNEEQTLEAETIKYARKATEIDRVFMAYIATKGHQFENKGRTDKIASYLLEILADLFGIYGTDAQKVVLYHLTVLSSIASSIQR